MAELRLPGILRRGLRLPRRMAGARRGSAFGPGPGSAHRIRRRRATGVPGRTLASRVVLALLAAAWLGAAQAQVLSSRIWPARDYTRLTLETKAELKYSIFSVKDPERLVLELETDEVSAALAELQGKVTADDPYVQGLRVARNRPGVVRVVLDLKAEVKPQAFTLKPIGEYGHRLVLDIYPAVEVDPLLALIEKEIKSLPPLPSVEPKPEERPKPGNVARLATIVLDPGHGGEDPGAIGRRGSREKNITLTIAKRLKGLIDAEPGMRAVLTRDAPPDRAVAGRFDVDLDGLDMGATPATGTTMASVEVTAQPHPTSAWLNEGTIVVSPNPQISYPIT